MASTVVDADAVVGGHVADTDLEGQGGDGAVRAACRAVELGAVGDAVELRDQLSRPRSGCSRARCCRRRWRQTAWPARADGSGCWWSRSARLPRSGSARCRRRRCGRPGCSCAIWALRLLLIPRPAASSPALVMRKPEDSFDSEEFSMFSVCIRFFCAFSEATLVRIDIAMTAFSCVAYSAVLLGFRFRLPCGPRVRLQEVFRHGSWRPLSGLPKFLEQSSGRSCAPRRSAPPPAHAGRAPGWWPTRTRRPR